MAAGEPAGGKRSREGQGREGQGREGQGREGQWIDWIRSSLSSASPLEVDLGDDAAVWKPPPNASLVLTVDAQSEGTHFNREWMSLEDIGRRSVTASVSDLAAMAADPRAVLIAILAPAEFSDAEFRELYRGIRCAADDYDVRIVGGNISRGELSVTVTSIGSCATGSSVRRDGLEVGQTLWVTGSPGAAHLGLLAFQRGMDSPSLDAVKRAFTRPVARLREAARLREQADLKAMLDLSDGLATDLRHLVDASSASIGVELDADALEALWASDIARQMGLDPVRVAMHGGEDYELCFALPPDSEPPRLDAESKVDLSCIGRVVGEAGVWVQRGGDRLDRSHEGFEHF